MLATDPDPPPDSIDAGKATRTRKRTERAQQMDEENERSRTDREKRQVKKQLAAKAASQSQLADTSDQFTFGPAEDFAEPTYTGNGALDYARYKAQRSKYLLRKLEYYSGEVLRPEWDAGNMTLAELEGRYREVLAAVPGQSASAKDKGKGKAVDVDEGRESNYPGITLGRPVDPPVLTSSNLKRQAADEDVGTSKKRRTDRETNVASPNDPHAGSSAPKSSNRGTAASAPAAASTRFSPVTRTDSSTLLGGQELFYPQNLPPDAQIHVPATAATIPDAVARKDRRRVPPGPKPPPVQPGAKRPPPPSGSLKILSFGPAAPHGPSQPAARRADTFPTPRTPPATRSDTTRHAEQPATRPTQTSQQSTGVPAATGRSGPRVEKKPAFQSNPNPAATANRAPKNPPLAHPPEAPSSRHQSKQLPKNHAAAGSTISGHRAPTVNQPPPAPNNGRAEAAHEEHRARPRNQQGNQRNRPRPRSHTPSDINDEEEELAAAPEEGDVPEFPNAQQSPTDPRMAILFNHKATLRSFAPVTHGTIQMMRHRAKAKMVSIGTYNYHPNDAGEEVPTNAQIVARGWVVANKKRGTDYPLLQEHLLHLEIVVRSFRSNVKHSLEEVVVTHWPFKTNTRDQNQRLCKKLLPHGFHRLAGAGGVVPFCHPYIRDACHKAIFEDATSMGIRYPTYFNPIPWRFIAFIAAISNHIIDSWRDGYYKKQKLDTDEQLPMFRKYLKRLEEMNDQQPNRLEELCGSIHDEGRMKFEETLEKPATPEPPIQWAPDHEHRYVPRFAQPRSDDEASEHSRDDEEPDEQDGGRNGDDYGKGSYELYPKSVPDHPQGAHHKTAGPRADDEMDWEAPGPSQPVRGQPEFQDHAGPSKHHYRNPNNSNDSNDDDLPDPRHALKAAGTGTGMRWVDDADDDADDETTYPHRSNQVGWGEGSGAARESPVDAEDVEYQDEREHDGTGECD